MSPKLTARVCIQFSMILFAVSAARAQVTESESWTITDQRSKPTIEGFPRVLIHKLQTNNTPVKAVIKEVCNRSNIIAISDKSVDGKAITTSYQDATTDEITAGILSKSRLNSHFLADNLLWIEADYRDPNLHKRKNFGDLDRSAPYSIEEQRQQKIREAARRKSWMEAQQQAQLEGLSNPTKYGLVPPPPPYAPSLSSY